MRLLITALSLLFVVSCAKSVQEVKVPTGKALFIVENTSVSEDVFSGLGLGNSVMMQFWELNGEGVGGTFIEVFDLTVDPGEHTVKVLCGISGNDYSNDHTIITLTAKADHKYVFKAYLKDGECLVKHEEQKG